MTRHKGVRLAKARKVRKKRPVEEDVVELKMQSGWLFPIYLFLVLMKWVFLTIIGISVPYKFARQWNLPYREDVQRWLLELFRIDIDPESTEYLQYYILLPVAVYLVNGFIRRFIIEKRVLQKITLEDEGIKFQIGSKVHQLAYAEIKEVKAVVTTKKKKKGKEKPVFKGFSIKVPMKTLFGVQPTKLMISKKIQRTEVFLEKMKESVSNFMPEDKYKELRTMIIESDNDFAKQLGRSMPVRNIFNSLFFVSTVVLCFAFVILQSREFQIHRPQYLLRNTALLFRFLYVFFEMFENSFMYKSVKKELKKRLNEDPEEKVRDLQFEPLMYFKRFPVILLVWASPFALVWFLALNTFVLDFSFKDKLTVYLVDSKVQCYRCETSIVPGQTLLTASKNVAISKKTVVRLPANKDKAKKQLSQVLIHDQTDPKVGYQLTEVLGKIIFSYTF